MSAQHTPTPWTAFNRTDGTTIEDANGFEIVLSAGCVARAAADHIVECVNAHDSLKALAGEAYPGIAHDLETLKAQNAEMAKALRAAANDLASLAVMLSPSTPACKFANEASDEATAAYSAALAKGAV